MNSIRHLEIIVALGTHRHFGRAAEALGISQPALTKSLHHIERLLGLKLFDRGGGISPTVFGEIVIARGSSIIDAFEELLREVQLTKGMDTGRLSLSVGLYPAEISTQEAVGLLSRAHPSITCDLSIKDWPEVVEDVLTARCDLGIADITEASTHPELETELVRNCPLLVVCRTGHPLTGLKRITLEDLFRYPWAGVRIPNAAQASLPQDNMPYGTVDPVTGRGFPRLRVSTFTGIQQAVLQSDAISAAPAVLIARGKGSFAALPVELPWLRLNYGFIWRRERSLSPAATELKRIVREIESGSVPKTTGLLPVARRR